MDTVQTQTPQVNVIPATKRAVESGGQFKKSTSLRVAAYCRVSTGDESQQTSYTTQKKFYSEMIASRSGWTFVGIYADEAISGTSRAHRVEFNKMIEDAMAGRLDYIVTKSISRFARNTVDTLKCVRELRNLRPAVGIYFEKENIDTLDATGELILTILSALAQDESRSISDNIRWSIQKNFQSGKPMVNLNRTLGYDKGPNGEWLINEGQAEIVRYIFQAFIRGTSATQIAKDLNEAGKKTVLGNAFRADAIYLILRNEKYVGDVEMQKTITKDFLTHKASRNTGEAPRYYIKDHHVGIIDRQTWDRAQAILYERGMRTASQTDRNRLDDENGLSAEEIAAQDARESHNKREHNPIRGLVYEDEEGNIHQMYRTGYHVPARGYSDSRSLAAEGITDTSGYREEYWFNNPLWKVDEQGYKIEGADRGYIDEVAIEQAFMEMLYNLKRDYEAHGEDSWISRQFEAFVSRIKARNSSGVSEQRLSMIDMQIAEMERTLQDTMSKQVEAMRMELLEQHRELNERLREGEISIDEMETDIRNGISGMDIGIRFLDTSYSLTPREGSRAAIYAKLAADIRKGLKEKKEERRTLESEQGAEVGFRRNFEFFLRCLSELPEEVAGHKVVVNGLDTDGSIFRTAAGKVKETMKGRVTSGQLKMTPERIEQAPNMLRYERGMYVAFVRGATLKRHLKQVSRGIWIPTDELIIEFSTPFGVTLTAHNVQRTLGSFLGFKRVDDDGGMEFIDHIWKVVQRTICYKRSEVKWKRKDLTEKHDRLYEERLNN